MVVVDGEPAAVEVIRAQDLAHGRDHILAPGGAPGAGGIDIADRRAVEEERAVEQVGIRPGGRAGGGIALPFHFEKS